VWDRIANRNNLAGTWRLETAYRTGPWPGVLAPSATKDHGEIFFRKAARLRRHSHTERWVKVSTGADENRPNGRLRSAGNPPCITAHDFDHHHAARAIRQWCGGGRIDPGRREEIGSVSKPRGVNTVAERSCLVLGTNNDRMPIFPRSRAMVRVPSKPIGDQRTSPSLRIIIAAGK